MHVHVQYVQFWIFTTKSLVLIGCSEFRVIKWNTLTSIFKSLTEKEKSRIRKHLFLVTATWPQLPWNSLTYHKSHSLSSPASLPWSPYSLYAPRLSCAACGIHYPGTLFQILHLSPCSSVLPWSVVSIIHPLSGPHTHVWCSTHSLSTSQVPTDCIAALMLIFEGWSRIDCNPE